MKKIFKYTDYRTYLKDLFNTKKKEASYFSLRNISSKIGMRSSGYLSMILNGQRNLSNSNAKKLAEVIKLSTKEQEYFLTLIQFNQAKDHNSKTELYSKLKRAASDPASTVKRENHIFYEKWYYPAIRELIGIYDVNDDNILEMANKLIPKIRMHEFKKGLEVLINTGLAFKNDKNIYKRSNNFITTGSDLQSFTIHKFQKETMSLAADALDRFNKDERELSTLTMSIDKSTYKKIIERSAAFRKEIMELVAETQDSTQAFQLNLQIFPLSNEKGDVND